MSGQCDCVLLGEENVCVSDRSASREWGVRHEAASLRDGVCKRVITEAVGVSGCVQDRDWQWEGGKTIYEPENPALGQGRPPGRLQPQRE